MPKTKPTWSRKKTQKTQRPQKPWGLHSVSACAGEAPSDVLELIYDYLSPWPIRCTGQLPNHMRVLQRLAGVNRQWRAVALPQLYHTVVVSVDEPTKRKRTPSEGNTLWTNIGLFGADLVRVAREVRITVRGSGQTSLLLGQKIQSAGLGDMVWPGVERLHLDTSKCNFRGLRRRFPNSGEETLDILNELLSAALPSLREIEFLGPGANKAYNCIPIHRLINAHLDGPQSLRVLRITSDIHLDFTSHLSRLSTPIELTCLDINTVKTPGDGAPLCLPPLLAGTLKELRLGSVYVRKLWEPFVAPSDSDLVFSSLKSLTLCFTLGREIQPREYNATKFSMVSEDEDWWEEEDDGYHGISEKDPEPEAATPGFMASTKFGTPQFPVLTSLEIRRFPRNLKKLLSLFESSPILTLSLWSLNHRIPDDLDLSPFGELRSLNVRFLDCMYGFDEEHVDTSLSSMFTTVNPKLQALTLMMHTYDPFTLEPEEPTFADNLTSLTLEGHIVLDHAITLLPLLANLQRLNIFASVTESVPAAAFMGKYKQEIAPHLLPPLSTSLRCVRAEHLQKFAEEERWFIFTDFPRNAAEEVSLYRHLILDLVCRVPSLETLMVSAASLEGVKKSINMLAKPGVGPEHMSCIRCVEIPVVDEFYFELDRG